MTVIYGLDSSTPPTLAQATKFFDLGYRFWGLYVDGNTPHKWTVPEIELVTSVGFQIVPITVALLTNNLSYQDGVDAGNSMLAAMQARGISGLGVLDVENGLEPVDFVHGFGDAMHAGQTSSMLYGLGNTLVSCAAPSVDLYWLARWMSFLNGVPPAPPDWDVWQVEDGTPCDFNAARSDFPFATFTPPT